MEGIQFAVGRDNLNCIHVINICTKVSGLEAKVPSLPRLLCVHPPSVCTSLHYTNIDIGQYYRGVECAASYAAATDTLM
jgi:hypothetical protein